MMGYPVLILANPDGSVAWVIRPATMNDDVKAKEELRLTMTKHPEWSHYRQIECRSDDLPSDGRHGGKWHLDGETIKARE